MACSIFNIVLNAHAVATTTPKSIFFFILLLCITSDCVFSMQPFMQLPMFTRGRARRSTSWRNRAVKTVSCSRFVWISVCECVWFSPFLASCWSLVLFLKKGAKEFVDQNMLRSQRSRRHRRQPRPHISTCPGPSQSAEESKPGDSDHETTSSSGENLLTLETNLLIGELLRPRHWGTSDWLYSHCPRYVWGCTSMYFYVQDISYCFEISFISPCCYGNCEDLVIARLPQRHQLVYVSDWLSDSKHYLLFSHPHTPFLEVTSAHLAEDESSIHVRLLIFLFSVGQPRKINLPLLTL